MLSKLTSLGSAAKGDAKGRAQRDDRETLREVMHSNALGVAALAARVEELERELKTTKAALLRVRFRGLALGFATLTLKPITRGTLSPASHGAPHAQLCA